MKPARLLRWYPRAWRERYGGELAALIQDNLAVANLAAASVGAPVRIRRALRRGRRLRS